MKDIVSWSRVQAILLGNKVGAAGKDILNNDYIFRVESGNLIALGLNC
jgi:hypothetical protein